MQTLFDVPAQPQAAPTLRTAPAPQQAEYVEPTGRENDNTQPERLFSFDIGTFETAKKSNHGTGRIAQSIVDSIEAGEVTSEHIAELATIHPIYRYKTCLTIHGHWPTVDRERIGQYKNIRQNQNGSLEVLWTAIDLRRKQTIGAALEAVNSPMQYRWNSSETYFEQSATIHNREQWNEALETMRATAERVKQVQGIHVRTFIWKLFSWAGMHLSLHVAALAVPEPCTVPLALALSGYDTKEALDAKIAEVKAQREADKEERQRQQAVRDAECEASIAPKVEQMKADMKVLSAHMEQFQQTLHHEPAPGHTYGTATYSRTELRSYIKTMKVSKGSFGRMKVEVMRYYVKDGAIDPEGEEQGWKFGRRTKELKADELKAKHKFPGTWKLLK